MKRSKVWHGYRYKKFVVVGDAPKHFAFRRVWVRCLACGEEKIVTVNSIHRSTLADCNCTYSVPKILPKDNGCACRARSLSCEISESGRCCYWCTEKEDCSEKCLNMPNKCGSFYVSKEERKNYE